MIGYEGKHVMFHNRYPEGYETNTKYFGKTDGFSFEKLVQTSHPLRWAKQGRFALFDNTSARILTAVILRLVLEDSGLYSFGVDVKLLPDLSGDDIQLTVRRGEAQRPTISLPTAIVSSTNSPANITAQNWTKTRNQETSLRFVSVLSLVCVCTLLVVCLFAVFKVLKWAATCKLSVSVSYHTRKTSTQVVDEYVSMSPTVLPNPPTAQNDEASLVDFHRPTNTEQTHNKDTNCKDLALADSPDQIYTEMNPGFVQESVYQSIDLTIN
ncbi:hypothetical protein ABG768_001230 [Culter alburnus]|uniref:Uncharacterized protein n=1 Tax=Culter alburnus TaxID=194366 RepID=A0AAW2B6U0_CULAL